MTPPDARQSDELREALADVLRRNHGQPSHPVEQYHREADAILPVVTAWHEEHVAEVVTRVKAIPTYKVITEDESLGYVVLADDVLAALATDDRTDPA